MYSTEWMDEVQRRAKTDEWYQVWLEEARKLEPAFLAIWNSLTEKQQEQLDDYISACENMEGALTLIAYNLGREHGKIIVVPPAER